MTPQHSSHGRVDEAGVIASPNRHASTSKYLAAQRRLRAETIIAMRSA